MKTALITGITGQDGSYLAEFLLEQGYRVVGMQRRTSTETVGRIAHLIDRIELVQGDLLDELSLIDLMRRYQPDEVYNLAAQSFVPTSWQQPVLTGEFTALGVTRMLEAIRLTKPDARFYQASSSEMFGKVQEVPQRETTPFYPRSPYGVSKVFGHWITVNYRESYNLFACSGILFNHECLSETTPLIVRRGETVNVVTPDELVPLRREGSSLQTFEPADLQVWDGVAWTDVQAITATHRRESDPDHQLLLIQARGGVAEVTAHHHMLDAEGCVLPARDVQPGNHLAMAVTLPGAPGWTALTREMAYFLGLLSAEGDVAPTGHIQFAHRDPDLRNRVADLWSRLFLGSTTRQTELAGRNTDRAGEPLSLNGAPAAGRWLREQLYNAADLKRVPPLVLNGTPDIQAAYLDGYHAGNGQKARNGVETNSAVLAQGLYWLYANQGRDCSVCAKRRGTTTCYQLTTGSDHGRETESGDLGGQASEVTQVAAASPGDWVFDVETAIGRLAAGVGRLVVHNSPRRGLEFVTRKVTHGVARIKLGLAGELRLGNLEAQRDWGYAPDYVRAMWLMLQQDEPTDYVVATGRTHSVRRLCELAFDAAGLNWQDYVVIDPRFIRPAEVDLLVGDAGKARAVLGWKPDVSFEEMVPLMVEADIALLSGKNAPAGMIGRL